MRPDTVLVAVTPSAPPRLAASAMRTISVTLGVSLANTGMPSAACFVHRQISSTRSGFCPQAKPIPFSPIPCGQERFNSTASAPASFAFRTSCFQSSSWQTKKFNQKKKGGGTRVSMT